MVIFAYVIVTTCGVELLENSAEVVGGEMTMYGPNIPARSLQEILDIGDSYDNREDIIVKVNFFAKVGKFASSKFNKTISSAITSGLDVDITYTGGGFFTRYYIITIEGHWFNVRQFIYGWKAREGRL